MTTSEYTKPLPRMSDLNRPFFTEAANGKLALQQCDVCRHIWFPAAQSCPRCLSKSVTWTAVSGRGHLWSWVVVHQAYIPAFRDDLPYLVAFVKLDEGPFMMTSLVGYDGDELYCDQPVEVVFEPVDDDIALPKFRPVAAGAGTDT